MPDAPSVLFVCTHNSARSVLAHALLRDRAGDGVRVFSAGTAPRGVHPAALTALAEAGISTAGLASGTIDAALAAIGGRPDVVVTVCDNAREACPYVPAGRTLHRSFPDPSAVPEADVPAAFADVRDAIAAWLDTDLIPSLSPPMTSNTPLLDAPDASTADDVRASVLEKYATVALGGDFGATTSCCGPGGCGTPEDIAGGIQFIGDDYATVDGYAAGADLGLGCGVPTEHAALAPGETVLDLGSGAGIDAFVAARAVGESGRVIGVDMTPAMVAKARANAAVLDATTVEFRLGEIEALPVETATVDVVISNCVLNLVPDKRRAFAEAFRVLRPGGRLCVSDVVVRGTLPPAVRASAELYAGCVSGAVEESAYLGGLRAAGFAGVAVAKSREITVPDASLAGALTPDELAAFRASGTGLLSVTVVAHRPMG